MCLINKIKCFLGWHEYRFYTWYVLENPSFNAETLSGRNLWVCQRCDYSKYARETRTINDIELIEVVTPK